MFEDEFELEKPQNFWKSIGQLLGYMKRYWLGILVSLVCALGGTFLTILGPSYLSRITDCISAGLREQIDLTQVLGLCKLVLGLYLGGVLLSYVQGLVMNRVSQQVSRNLRTAIDEQIDRVPLRYFDGVRYGNILSRVTNDVDNIAMTLNNSIVGVMTDLVTMLGTLVMMCLSSGVLTLVAVGAGLLGFGLSALVVSRSQKYFTRRQEQLGELNGYIEEQYTGHTLVLAYGREASCLAAFRRQNGGLYQSTWKAEFLSGLIMPMMGFMGNLGYAAVCVVGGAMAIQGKISFGVIVAFLIYVRMFSEPLSMLAQLATMLQSAAAAGERVFNFLEEETLSDERDVPPCEDKASGQVELRHLRFGYEPDRPVIRDLSLAVRPGQKIAIVGPTGAGKTTLVNLLMRFYEPESGEILLDGVPISQRSRAWVHEQFCMVLQDTWLFEGSLRENLSYATQGLTEERLTAAMTAVGLEHYLRAQPQGFDTQLSERAELSAGQKQQLTIARAILKDTPILILDEATSSVDTRTELVIQRAMDALMEGRTSFIIAHRLSTVRNADCILCLDHGDVVEQGSHDELLARGGFYARLWNSQFEEA